MVVEELVGWLVRWFDGWLNRWLNGWLDRWLDGWLDEWLVSWLDGCLDVWVDILFLLLFEMFFDKLTHIVKPQRNNKNIIIITIKLFKL